MLYVAIVIHSLLTLLIISRIYLIYLSFFVFTFKMVRCEFCSQNFEFFRDRLDCTTCCKCTQMDRAGDDIKRAEIAVSSPLIDRILCRAYLRIQCYAQCRRCSLSFRFMRAGELCGVCKEESEAIRKGEEQTYNVKPWRRIYVESHNFFLSQLISTSLFSSIRRSYPRLLSPKCRLLNQPTLYPRMMPPTFSTALELSPNRQVTRVWANRSSSGLLKGFSILIRL